MITSDRRAKSQYKKDRAVRRCSFVATAEVTDLRSGTRLLARTTEIGMGGCYVDVLNPFPKDAAVHVRIVRDQGSFETKAKVVYSDEKFGMGLAFSGLTPQQRAVLEGWLVELVTLLNPTS
jgi:PilZ domain